MNNKLCSVMVPSRRRFNVLKESIASLYNKVTNQNSLEVLVRLDDDDKDSYKILDIPQDWDIQFIVGNRYRGYIDLNLMYGELCKRASGEFLWMWNDDCLVETFGWDEEIEKWKGKMVILSPSHSRNAGNQIPIIHRSIYDVTGHWAQTRFNDDWYEFLAYYMNFSVNVPEIFVEHQTLPYEHVKDGLPSGQAILPMTVDEWKILKADVEKLKQYQKEHPELYYFTEYQNNHILNIINFLMKLENEAKRNENIL